VGLFSFCVLHIKENATCFILPGFSLEPVLSVIQTHRITNLTLVPPVAVLLIKSPIVKNYDLSSVSHMFCGAAPLGKEASLQLEHVFSKSGALPRQGYGMSEATCAITLFGPDEWDDSHEGVGYLTPNMEAKIVDLEGKEVGAGDVGELLIRGPNATKGYWKNPEATKEMIDANGWLSTGDFVKMNEKGLFSVIDRKKVCRLFLCPFSFQLIIFPFS
jgi:4-coumarate--CoA ligase